ncbi:helix-turn-helix domain-containing protein [Actinosynnema sp. NPDC020468]|uniref:helix-turn-helix domain-containing protein n=1 Tax=Actinosynnema sp. NPDC020468 TaxID=3154488 RepID=UPI0034062780
MSDDMDLSAGIEDWTAAFVLDLREEHIAAGKPSYRSLHRKTYGELAPATITRSLSGRQLPSWQFVERFLRACDVDDDGLTRWRRRWYEIRRRDDPELADRVPGAVALGAEAGPVDGCETCGVAVLDPVRHRRWHESVSATRRMRAV